MSVHLFWMQHQTVCNILAAKVLCLDPGTEKQTEIINIRFSPWCCSSELLWPYIVPRVKPGCLSLNESKSQRCWFYSEIILHLLCLPRRQVTRSGWTIHPLTMSHFRRFLLSQRPGFRLESRNWKMKRTLTPLLSVAKATELQFMKLCRPSESCMTL